MAALIVCGLIGLLAALGSRHYRPDSRPLRLFVVAFSVMVMARYVLWRVIFTLPELGFSVPSILARLFLTLEIVVFVELLVELSMLRRTSDRSPDATRQLDWYGKRQPRVDIFIPTYDEPWDVLEKTIIGATHQDYESCHVWLLDDGRREWLRRRADALGVGYVTRDGNDHYKAGNLQNAISELRARGVSLELIAILDADFIARPEFVRRGLSLMQAEDVGIVQTPQSFYNEDPFQRVYGGVRRWPDEQRIWFDVQLPSLDAAGQATCCGTSCLLRVAALDAIGGFPTESLSEDGLTSQKMAQKGWRTVYLNERLSVGLAPEGVGEFLKQRVRWLHGEVQNLRYFGRGPGAGGAISYFCRLWRRATSAAERLAWPVFAIVFWLTGAWILPVNDPIELASYFVPLWLARWLQGVAYGGRQGLFISDAHGMLLAPVYIKENLRAVLRRPLRFDVTHKGVRSETSVTELRHVRIQLALALALLGSAGYVLFTPTAVARQSALLPLLVVATSYSLLVLWAAVGPAIQPPRRRRSDRYATTESITAITSSGKRLAWRCEDISLEGVLVHAPGWDAEGPVDIELAGVGRLQARRVRRDPNGATAFAFDTLGVRARLIRKIYCTEGYIPAPQRWRASTAVVSCLHYLFTLVLALPSGEPKRRVPSVNDVSA